MFFKNHSARLAKRSTSEAKCPVLSLLRLEDRVTPADITWVGPQAPGPGQPPNSLWSNPNNWDLARLPNSGDTLLFRGGSGNTDSYDDIASLTVHEIQCTSGFTSDVWVAGDRVLTVQEDFVEYGTWRFHNDSTLNVGNDFFVYAELETGDTTINAGAIIVHYGALWYQQANTTSIASAAVEIAGTHWLQEEGISYPGGQQLIDGSYEQHSSGVLDIQEGAEFEYSGVTVAFLEGTTYLGDPQSDTVNATMISDSGWLLQGTLVASGEGGMGNGFEIHGDLDIDGGTIVLPNGEFSGDREFGGDVYGDVNVSDGFVDMLGPDTFLKVHGDYVQDNASELEMHFNNLIQATGIAKVSGTVLIDLDGVDFSNLLTVSPTYWLYIIGNAGTNVSVSSMVVDYTLPQGWVVITGTLPTGGWGLIFFTP